LHFTFGLTDKVKTFIFEILIYGHEITIRIIK